MNNKNRGVKRCPQPQNADFHKMLGSKEPDIIYYPFSSQNSNRTKAPYKAEPSMFPKYSEAQL